MNEVCYEGFDDSYVEEDEDERANLMGVRPELVYREEQKYVAKI
jgi:hypothetical protein